VHNVVHMANVVVVASVTVTKLSKSSVRLGVVSQQFVHAVDCAPRTSALGSITHGILSCARLTTGTDVSNVMHAARYFPQFLSHRDGSRCTAPLLPKSVHSCSARRFQHTTVDTTGDRMGASFVHRSGNPRATTANDRGQHISYEKCMQRTRSGRSTAS
jgi:hypothetical protein